MAPLINKNPLPQGTYRIRSFNSKFLLTAAQNESPYVTDYDPTEPDFQKWLVTPQANSTYTIYNTKTGQYLASPASRTEGTSLISQTAASDDVAFKWSIQTTDMGIMFFIGVPDESFSIGFLSYEAEDLSIVTLQTNDNIPSQIWFFELFKTLTPAKFHAKQLLAAGNYVLQLADDNNYLTVNPRGDLGSTTNQNDTDPLIQKFTLTYPNANSPNFTLTFPKSGSTAYLSAGRGLVEVSNRRKEWVLVPMEGDDSGTVFYICDATPSDPRRAFSTRRSYNLFRTDFALDALSEQQEQLWRFIQKP